MRGALPRARKPAALDTLCDDVLREHAALPAERLTDGSAHQLRLSALRTVRESMGAVQLLFVAAFGPERQRDRESREKRGERTVVILDGSGMDSDGSLSSWRKRVTAAQLT